MSRSITKLAHEWALERLSPGVLAIDATCGNGHDTLFLAQAVGGNGRVAAFDVQEKALEATRARLEKFSCNNIEYFCMGHEKMLSVLGESWRGNVSAVFFNLGYLPSADHGLTTQGATTLAALDAVREHLLARGGLISLAVYTGHPGGFEESAMVAAWVERVPACEIRRWGCHNPRTPWLVQLVF